MGKLTSALLLVAIIEFALYVFGYQSTLGTFAGLLMDPTQFVSSPIYSFLNSGIFAIFAGAFVIASLTIFRTDFPIYVGLGAIMFTWIFPIFDLARLVYSLEYLPDPQVRAVVTFVIIAPLTLLFMMATLDWMRGRD